MEDDESTEVSNEAPAEELSSDTSDQILNELSDTEDDVTPEPSGKAVETDKVEDETPPEVEPPKEAEELQPEADPKDQARRWYEERQAKIAQRREQFTKQAEEAAQQHLDASEDEVDQRIRQVEANDAKREYARYVENIERNENILINEFERVKANPNLQMFNPESDTFNAKLYEKATKDFNLGYIQYDTQGNMYGLKGSLYEYLTETAELFQDAIKSGQIQQVKDTRQMKHNADIKPAAAPKEKEKDSILDILTSD